MEITEIGYVLMAISVVVFVRRWNQLLYWAIFFTGFSATSMLNIQSLTFGFTPYIYFSVLYCAAGLLTGSYRKLSRPAPFRDTVVLGIALFGAVVLVATIIAGLEGEAGMGHVTQSAYFFLGLVMACVVAFALGDPEVRVKAFRTLRYGAMFVAAWGFFQLAGGYAGLEYPSWIFNNSASDFAGLFDQKFSGGIHRISSVAVEPSFLAYSLVNVFAFCSTRLALGGAAVRRTELLPVLMIGACLLLSTSTTAYLGLAVCGAMLLVAQPVRMAMVGGIALLAAMLLLHYFGDFAQVLDEVTFSKLDSFSFKDRIANTHRGWELFIANPFLGAGWGSAQDSMPVLILANAGLIGLVPFALAYVWTLVGTGKAMAQPPDAATRDLWLDCAGCQTALYASLAMSMASGFKYHVFDFWFMWGAAIACVAALHWSKQVPAAMRARFPDAPLATATT